MNEISLTIVVPVYNEEDRVHLAIDALSDYEPPDGIRLDKVVFVDDGSEDDTVRVLRDAEHRYPCDVVSYPENRGRGYAVRRGLSHMESDYALYLDADMSIPLDNLEDFVPAMQDGVDVLAGSKKMKETVCTQKRSLLRKLIGWGHSAISSLALGVWMSDFQGGFKAFSRRVVRDVLPRTSMERWGMDPEVIYVADRMGCSIAEIPVVWGHVEQGTKVRVVRDIARALADLVKIRWNDLRGEYRSAPEPDALAELETVHELGVS